MPNIIPIGPAVHGDFYTVTGCGIPEAVTLVFDPPRMKVEFAPDLVRPGWLFVAELPDVIPTGPNTLQLKAPGVASDVVPVNVTAGPKSKVSVLNPGARKPAPYTVAFVANPAILRRDGVVEADPALRDRRRFHWKVRFCLRNLLHEKEDLLRQFDPDIRFVAVFDDMPATEANALVQEHPTDPTFLEPRRHYLGPFLAGHGVMADVVIVLHGKDEFYRAYAWPTTDDVSRAGTSFTYDHDTGIHFPYATIPGSVALPMGATAGAIALHEFCHAAASFDSGAVIDLYNDTNVPGITPGRRVNKKWRQQAGGGVPTSFAAYEGWTYDSDPDRDGLGGYPASWASYHPVLTHSSRPNLMDNFWLTHVPMSCRLDRLTHAWLSDRLRAKVYR